MARTRELLRQAQASELAGEKEKAARLLAEAARLHAEAGETARAAALYRHCLRLVPDDPEIQAAATAAEEPAGQPSEGRALEIRARGPVLADPILECWCSFCCRPKSEVGPMAAGPAGAFVCAACAETCGSLLAGGANLVSETQKPSAIPDSADPTLQVIEAAVILSRSLGWSLSDVRGLSEAERRHALMVLARLEPNGLPPR